jgi:hypothetical protein
MTTGPRTAAQRTEIHATPVEIVQRTLDTCHLARLCWAIDGRRRMLAMINIAAAGCFVVGCVGFYWPSWYVPSLTMFLVGSFLFLLGAVATALVEHGPST